MVGFDRWDRVLDDNQSKALKRLLGRRIDERTPLAYLTGEARFCGLNFIVSSDVLIPRSPLAELIPERFSPWLAVSSGGRVLDMCTGGACIAIAMSLHMPEMSVDAVDISSAALKVAQMNVDRHQVNDRVKLVQSDPRSYKLAGATRLRFQRQLPDNRERQQYVEQLLDSFAQDATENAA